MNKFEQSLEKELEKIQKLKKLFTKYPDLTEHENRWGTKYLVSASVNAIADNWGISHSCGCCDDAVVYVQTYIVEDGFEIYSDPFQIAVGSKYIGYDDFETNWQEILKNKNIQNPSIYKDLEKYALEQEELIDEELINSSREDNDD